MKFFLTILLVGFSFPIFSLTIEEKKTLIRTTRWLAQFGVKYAQKWTPPAENTALVFDCSGSAKFIYEKALGKKLPRSSYAQYLEMKEKNLYFEINPNEKGVFDFEQLKKNLKIGDLLFWINTHSDIEPDRNPPVSHVMIYLGYTKDGKMKMGGGATFGKGEVALKGGPDIYYFDPNAKIGCVKKNGVCVKNSQFIGYGRPF